MRSPTALLTILLIACRSGDKLDEGEVIDSGVPETPDADADGYDADEDCDDNNSVVNPGAEEICDGVDNNCDGVADEGVTTTFYADTDGDGFGDSESTTEACEQPEGYVPIGSDCDDNDADSWPSATERCDGVDNDCDGEVDEDVTTVWYADGDDDGYGDADAAVTSCDPEAGYVADSSDCDDTNADAFPDNPEVCDEVDNDCDGTVDEGVTTTFYEDVDGDSFGVSDVTTESCDLPTGYAADAGDCDDAEEAINPDSTEVCDGVDNDCDGTVDEDDAADAQTFYADDDSDGYGDPDSTTAACAAPSGYVEDATDCDDANNTIHPDAEEVCDGVDNDCDGTVDEDDAADAETFYADDDSDGYGDADDSTVACEAPSGFVSDATDCDDTESAANPGESEVCDEIDNDCDGETDEGVTTTFYTDDDSDGFGDADAATDACEQPSGTVTDATDCDDTDSAINPDAEEVCDGIDNDCDGTVDEDAASPGTFYADDDGDGYGDPDSVTEACEAPSGTVSDATDCDDTDADINPDAEEVCDGVDNDCDGQTDEDDADGASTWYADDDSDGFGDPDSTTAACEAPGGYVADDTDCDDTEIGINPDAEEVCDGIDNDCDGSVDALVCLDVSNVDSTLLEESDSSLSISSDTTIDTESGEIDGVRSSGEGLVDGIYFEVVTQSGGPDLGVFVVDGMTLSSGATLEAVGDNGLVILSTDDVDISGTLTLLGADGTDGLTTSGPNSGGEATAAGGDGGDGSNNAASGGTSGSGDGAGQVGAAGVHYGNGGGGGGHCYGGGGGMGDRPSVAGSPGSSTAGGAGGYGGGDGGYGGDGGDPYSAFTLTPLTAGSGGSGGLADTDYNPNGAGGGGGAGGGAVQLSIDGLLTISGSLQASGGAGGEAYGGGGGGGSGGGILLEALELEVSGTLDATGGDGGDGNLSWAPSGTTGGDGGGSSSMGGGGGSTESGGGGGAAGWLYLRYLDSYSVTGTLTPDTSTDCASSGSM